MATEGDGPLQRMQRIGASMSVRTLSDGSIAVWGIQCRHTAAGDEHAAMMAEFSDLRALGLQGTHITNAALHSISTLRHLESLDLDDTPIDDAGLALLGQMTSLEFLHIERTRVTEGGVRSLQQRLSSCDICSDWS